MTTKLVNGARIELTDNEMSERNAERAAYVVPVPQVVTQMQGRIAMSRAGILIAITDSMNLLPVDNEDRITWETASTFRRDYPMIEAIRVSEGLTVGQIDDLFIVAGGVT